MTRIEELAEALGMTTADRIDRPPAAAPVTLPAFKDWDAALREEWRYLAPCAVYIAGGDGPEPRSWGDNMGAWPILLGLTERWDDTISPTMDRLSPLRARGVLFRVWTASREHGRRLIALIEGLMRERVEQLRGSWVDIGIDCDLSILELEIHALAQRNGLPAWDDAGLYGVVRKLAGERARAETAAEGRVR